MSIHTIRPHRSPLLVLGIAVLGWAAAAPRCSGEQFHGRNYGYHITLPHDWVTVPKDVLDDVFAQLRNQATPSTTIYDAAFQLASAAQWFEYPYVLVQPLPYSKFGLNRQLNEDEFPRYISMITGVDVTKIVDESFAPDIRGLLQNTTLGQPQLDTSNRRYLLTINMDVAGIGPVRGLMVGYFGRDSIVQIMFYSRRAEWDQHATVASLIMDSFRFDPEKAYSVQTAIANPTPPSLWSRVAAKGIAGAIGGGLFALIFGGIAASKRKKEPPQSADP